MGLFPKVRFWKSKPSDKGKAAPLTGFSEPFSPQLGVLKKVL
jgi:hypothetical protein